MSNKTFRLDDMGFCRIETSCGLSYEGKPSVKGDRCEIIQGDGVVVDVALDEIVKASRHGVPGYAEMLARGRLIWTDGETYIRHGSIGRADDVDHPVWGCWELIRENEEYYLRCNSWHVAAMRRIRRIKVVDLCTDPAPFILEVAETDLPLDLNALMRALQDLVPEMPEGIEATPSDVVRHCDGLMIKRLAAD